MTEERFYATLIVSQEFALSSNFKTSITIRVHCNFHFENKAIVECHIKKLQKRENNSLIKFSKIQVKT